jgi:hypothetical protein
MIDKVFVLLTLWPCIWACGELSEIESYLGDIEYCLREWSVCKIYTQQEMDSLPQATQFAGRERLIEHMKSMNSILDHYANFKLKRDEGLALSAKIKTFADIDVFQEEFFASEDAVEGDPNATIERCLKYCGIFLAKRQLISMFSGDRIRGEPYYKATTEPVYLYMKKLKEDIEYDGGCIGRYSEALDKLNQRAVKKVTGAKKSWLWYPW